MSTNLLDFEVVSRPAFRGRGRPRNPQHAALLDAIVLTTRETAVCVKAAKRIDHVRALVYGLAKARGLKIASQVEGNDVFFWNTQPAVAESK